MSCEANYSDRRDMTFRWAIFFLTLSLAPAGAKAQYPSGPENPHADTICGLAIGMSPDEVLATMKRAPDGGKVEGDSVNTVWKLPEGNVVTVLFRKKQYVVSVGLAYHPALMVQDLKLPNSVQAHPSFEVYEPGSKLEYQRGQTEDGRRIWRREVKHPSGYTFEVGFLSASSFKVGAQFFESLVESKFITVRKDYLDKLDKAMASAPKKLAPDPGAQDGNPR